MSTPSVTSTSTSMQLVTTNNAIKPKKRRDVRIAEILFYLIKFPKELGLIVGSYTNYLPPKRVSYPLERVSNFDESVLIYTAFHVCDIEFPMNVTNIIADFAYPRFAFQNRFLNAPLPPESFVECLTEKCKIPGYEDYDNVQIFDPVFRDGSWHAQTIDPIPTELRDEMGLPSDPNTLGSSIS